MNNKFKKRQQFDRIMSVGMFVSILMAGILGLLNERDFVRQGVEPLIKEGETLENIGEGLFQQSNGEYIIITEAQGFIGPIQMAAQIDTAGSVVDMNVVSHKETPAYMEKVMDAKFQTQLLGKDYRDQFVESATYDAISGATYTSVGMANAINQGIKQVARLQLNKEIPAQVAVPRLKPYYWTKTEWGFL